MKNIIILLISLSFFYSCASDDGITTFVPTQNEFDWIVDSGITGSFNPFPLAKDPIMSKVKDIDFISDKSIVAIVSIGEEIRIYPYQFISRFEAVNDKINDINYTMTYCPITQSGLVMDREFKDDNFILRASGYLFNDNQVLFDEKSDTFWSQMLVKCIKGKYAGEIDKTYNFVEMPWKIVKENFPDALVFTNVSIANKTTTKKDNIEKGDLVYGIVNFRLNQNIEVSIFRYQDFSEGTRLSNIIISGNKILVIGNEDKHFITSYINNSNATFKAVQNQFPIVMEDDDNNKWNVFGVAVSGPRKGEQLQSQTAFVALWWAWENFYSNFIFE